MQATVPSVARRRFRVVALRQRVIVVLGTGARAGHTPRVSQPYAKPESSVRRAARTRAWASVACVALAWLMAAPASASVLYRCTGPGGETAYVSHTAGYRHCVQVGRWAAPAARPIRVSERMVHQGQQPSGTVLPGKPPKDVVANPEVLKVTPLGTGDSIEVQTLAESRVWQPLPVAILGVLGRRVLPVLLGLESGQAPAAAEPASATSAPPPAPAATAAIPLKVTTAAHTPPRRGAVYRVQRKDGTVLYTNVAALAQGQHARMLFTYIVECYACSLHSKIDWNTVPLHLADYGTDIRSAVAMTGVSAALLRAVIHAESGFNSSALSYKRAQGLMQLMPATAFELGVGNAFDPGENISGGARYLAGLLRDYHGDVRLAAAAYNAGAGAVAKYGGVPPYAETEVYVKRVALLYQRYQKALAGAGGAATLAAARAD
jgi:soluble lytic murein transglycosylase-like protein